VAGYGQVLEDEPEHDMPESDKEEHVDEFRGMYTSDMLDKKEKPRECAAPSRNGGRPCHRIGLDPRKYSFLYLQRLEDILDLGGQTWISHEHHLWVQEPPEGQDLDGLILKDGRYGT
jgi:hypothetical protein